MKKLRAKVMNDKLLGEAGREALVTLVQAAADYMGHAKAMTQLQRDEEVHNMILSLEKEQRE